MVAKLIDIAQAATTATLLMRKKSMAESATFSRDMDQSRRAIRASRERLRQRHRDDVARGWEDADPSTVAVSAFQADVLRSAFRGLDV